MVVARFYSFRLDDGRLSGLVRQQHPGPVFAYVDREQGGWVEKDELARHLLAGAVDFEEIDEAQARELAERYGVPLDPDADFRVRDDGSTFHVRPTSDAGRAWLAFRYRDEELTPESGVAVESRKIERLVGEIERDGLRVGPHDGPAMLDQWPGEAEDWE